MPEQGSISGVLHIERSADAAFATITTQSTTGLPPVDLANCPLRYSGSLFLSGGALGRIENFIDNSNNEANQYATAVFSAFEPGKKYKQVLPTCVRAETVDSAQVRFLMLAGNIIVEASTPGLSDSTPTIHHYKQVDRADPSVLSSGETF